MENAIRTHAQGAVCGFQGPDGQQCHARPLRNGSYCFWHDPDKSDARKAAGRLGGAQGRRKTLPEGLPEYRLTSADRVAKLLSRTVNQTLRGELDPKVANAVGYLAGIILKAQQQGDLEQRMKELEDRLAASEKR